MAFFILLLSIVFILSAFFVWGTTYTKEDKKIGMFLFLSGIALMVGEWIVLYILVNFID